MDRHEFLKKCVEVDEYWNEKMPIMACEEAGELIQAISKAERKGVKFESETYQNLVDEIGDMYITLMALQNHYNINEGDIEVRIEKKLNKKY